MFRLKDECSSMSTILDQVKYRSEWIKYQEAQRRKEEEELEKERGRFQHIAKLKQYRKNHLKSPKYIKSFA
jgi:hypothetical protein